MAEWNFQFAGIHDMVEQLREHVAPTVCGPFGDDGVERISVKCVSKRIDMFRRRKHFSDVRLLFANADALLHAEDFQYKKDHIKPKERSRERNRMQLCQLDHHKECSEKKSHPDSHSAQNGFQKRL